MNWKASQGGMTCPACKQYLARYGGIAVTRREDSFQQYDRLPGHVDEALHPHSVGL